MSFLSIWVRCIFWSMLPLLTSQIAMNVASSATARATTRVQPVGLARLLFLLGHLHRVDFHGGAPRGGCAVGPARGRPGLDHGSPRLAPAGRKWTRTVRGPRPPEILRRANPSVRLWFATERLRAGRRAREGSFARAGSAAGPSEPDAVAPSEPEIPAPSEPERPPSFAGVGKCAGGRGKVRVPRRVAGAYSPGARGLCPGHPKASRRQTKPIRRAERTRASAFRLQTCGPVRRGT